MLSPCRRLAGFVGRLREEGLLSRRDMKGYPSFVWLVEARQTDADSNCTCAAQEKGGRRRDRKA
jgi:hypothetical protein